MHRIVIFGDSLSDTGGFAKNKIIPRSIAGYSKETRRFTDDRTWVDLVAESLGLNTFYFDDRTKLDEVVTNLTHLNVANIGTETSITNEPLLNFAVGGSVIGKFRKHGKAFFGMTAVDDLSSQLKKYRKVMKDLRDLTIKQVDKAKSEVTIGQQNALYICWLGGNDVATFDFSHDELESNANTLVNQIDALCREDDFSAAIFLGLPDLSIAPRFAGDKNEGLRNQLKEKSEFFNTKLLTAINTKKNQVYPNRLYYLDIGAAMNMVVTPSNVEIPLNTLSWTDGLHPSHMGHNVIATIITKTIMDYNEHPDGAVGEFNEPIALMYPY